MNELAVDYVMAGVKTLLVIAIFVFSFFYVRVMASTIYEEWRGCTKAGKAIFVRVLVVSVCVSYYVCRYVLEVYP